MKESEYTNNRVYNRMIHIALADTHEESISKNLVNLKMFEHNYSWINKRNFNLDIIHMEDTSVHMVHQTIVKGSDDDNYQLITHKFQVSGLYNNTRIIEILRLAFLDPEKTVSGIETIKAFEQL